MCSTVSDKLNWLCCQLDGCGDCLPLSARGRMPYTEAFIMESLRLATFVPITEPHKAMKVRTHVYVRAEIGRVQLSRKKRL